MRPSCIWRLLSEYVDISKVNLQTALRWWTCMSRVRQKSGDPLYLYASPGRFALQLTILILSA